MTTVNQVTLFRVVRRLAFAVTLIILFSVRGWAQDSEVQEALYLADLGKTDLGIQQLSSALAARPDVIRWYYYLGLLQLGNGKLDEAKVSFDRGLSLDPKAALVYVGQGHLLLMRKNEAEAMQMFDKALALSKKKSAEVMQAIARAYLMDSSRVEQAESMLVKARDLEVTNANTYLLLGDLYLSQQKGGPAASSYEWAAQYNPKMAKPHHMLGVVYLMTGERKLAEESFQKAVAIDKNYAPSYKELAEISYQRKDGIQAVKYFESYLALVNGTDRDRARYAYFLFMARDFSKANEVFSELTRNNDVTTMTLRYYAYSLQEAGAFAESKAIFERYFAQNAQVEAGDYAYYGKLLLKLGEDSLAVVNLTRSLDMNRQQPEIIRLVAETQLKRKKYREAATAYRVVLSTAKPLSQDYYSYGRACYFSEQYVAADSAFTMLISLQPTMPVGYLWEARTQSSLDPESEKGLAKPYYDKLIELTLPNADKGKSELIEAYSYLGYYHYLRKEFGASKRYWKKVQALEPSNEKAKEALRALK